jgi:hypothetical protein
MTQDEAARCRGAPVLAGGLGRVPCGRSRRSDALDKRRALMEEWSGVPDRLAKADWLPPARLPTACAPYAGPVSSYNDVIPAAHGQRRAKPGRVMRRVAEGALAGCYPTSDSI